METERITLGSGNLYVTAFSGGEIPEDTEIETTANLIGLIKGGATLEYKPTEYAVNDDSFKVIKRFVIAEESTFKSGVLTWNLETLKNLIASGTYTDDSTEHKRTLKLGGNGARLMKEYLIRFVHDTSDGEKFRVTLVGTASEGFSIAFAPDKETVIDAVFKACGHDSSGTQVILEETYTPVSGG